MYRLALASRCIRASTAALVAIAIPTFHVVFTCPVAWCAPNIFPGQHGCIWKAEGLLVPTRTHPDGTIVSGNICMASGGRGNTGTEGGDA